VILLLLAGCGPAAPPPTATASPAPRPTTAAAPVVPRLATFYASPGVRLSPTPRLTATPESGRYLGRDPLPPGIDLSTSPHLSELEQSGLRGVRVGDGGLGDALKDAYLAALQVEAEALTTLDASRLPDFFSGPQLEFLQHRIAEQVTATTHPIVDYQARVMPFLTTTSVPDTYWLIDARTETISTAERQPGGLPGRIVAVGTPARECYVVALSKAGDRWKVTSAVQRHGGPRGYWCPPFWS
jgi:hypothetical protein